MSELSVNTKTIEGIAENIKKYAGEYQIAVDNYFKEIENLKDVWGGVDKEKFVNQTLMYKNQCDNYRIILEKYVRCLKQYSSDLQTLSDRF